MNAINSAVTRLFDVLLVPLEALGDELALILVSAVFGILALLIFKRISNQRGIKAAKNKIKGHMIEIRLYQDDLGIVARAIGKVLLRNFQYLAYNFGPFLPLAVPFVFIVAQMVVRYGFEPAPVQTQVSGLLAGRGTTLAVELDAGRRADVAELEVVLPEGLVALSPLVRAPSRGRAFQEFAAIRPGEYDLVLKLGDSEVVKRFYAGEGTRVRAMQPERVRGVLFAMLWPAEDSLARTGFARVSFTYPESDLGWLPMSGPLGVLVMFVLFSMAFGFALVKPLGIQI